MMKGLASLDSFEHLSQYDPDDEFLQSNNSISLIECISLKKQSSQVSETSEFSIISSGQIKSAVKSISSV